MIIALGGAALFHAPIVAAQLGELSPPLATKGGVESNQSLNSSVVHEGMAVDVVFVGIGQDTALLKQDIVDLLKTHGITASFKTRSGLDTNDLFAFDRSRSTYRTTVWVLMPRPDDARLVFADPAFQRFLLREIPLPLGLDVLGRETMAQVIESSTLALLGGVAGVSRSELSNSLGPTLQQSSRAPLPAVSSEVERPKKPRREIRHRLGANYGFNFSGSDLGVLHGPGITAGLESAAPSGSCLLTATFEWRFERHRRTADVDLALQCDLVWLLAGLRTPLRDRTYFVVAIGPGVELSRASATASGTGSVPIDPSATRLNPWARFQMGLEWGDSPLVFQLSWVTDLSPYRTRFQVVHDGTSATLMNPLAVRPGLLLAALWR